MKIGILGSGSVGSFFGSFLSEAGHDVTFIARGAHLAEMNKKGLLIKRDNDEITIHNTFTEDISALAECELVLFCVKSGDTRETAEKLVGVLNKSASVMSFQNGVSNEEVLVDVFGEDRVLSAVVFVQAAIKSPGVVEQYGSYGLVIGGLSEIGMNAAEKIAIVLKEAGVPVKCTDQVMLRKWKKYLFSLLFNPLTAAIDKTIGEILEDPHLKKIAWSIGLETVQVAALCGIPLTEKDIEQAFQNAELAKTHATSMLQDIRKGKVTEADELVGYVLDKAEIHGLSIDTLKTIYFILKNKENNLPTT
ncbi:ketopantoate reductase family protein [Sporosarcina siberiensis]|uniref:2-dehydropantoate 2-reductase n=1 Tax=Sporosarcina siberiensis TaxID=1365606 RepID=A0ABW4SEP7_9BACL